MRLDIRAASCVFVCLVGCVFESGRAIAQSLGGSGASLVTGTVKTTDGSDLPPGVRIRLVCDGSVRIVAGTGITGDFSFRWNVAAPRTAQRVSQDSAQMSGAGRHGSQMDFADDSGAMESRNSDPAMSNCEISADYAGYRSSEVVLSVEDADDSDIGTIWLGPLAKSGGNLVSITSLSAPKEAKKYLETGRNLARRHKIPEAIASVEKATAVYPKYAEAWVVLGGLQFETRQYDAARSSMEKATGIDSRLLTPWQVLGYIAAGERRWDDAARYLDQAVHLEPTNSAVAWFYDGWAHYQLGHLDTAERSAKASLGMDPRPAGSQSEYLLGVVLIARQDFPGGEQALRSFVASSPDTQRVRSANEILRRMEHPVASSQAALR